MEKFSHTINTLFEQLGLNSTDKAIEEFIKQHSPVCAQLPLYKANFWSSSQADFLRQALEEDSDWTSAVDTLSTMLR